MRFPLPLTAALLLTAANLQGADTERKPLQMKDVFQLEWASDPQISPDGKQVVYVRNFMDVMKDRRRSNLWVIRANGSDHQALTTGNVNDSSPRWSADGKRIAFLSSRDGTMQLHCLWVDTNRTACLTRAPATPSAPQWSPDGKQIAFLAHVPEKERPFIELPAAPPGAEWAAPPKVIRKTIYRADGRGYLPAGEPHVFVIGADGGAPGQVTLAPLDLGGRGGQFAWTPDSKALIVAANHRDTSDDEPLDTDLYEVSLEGKLRKLTNRRGPDHSPAVSPDGKHIAYLGFDDKHQGYQVTRLYVVGRNGKEPRLLSGDIDRDIQSPAWSKDGKSIFFLYAEHGDMKVANITLDGKLTTLTGGVGAALDRPYLTGSFSVAGDGMVAFTHASPDHLPEVGILSPKSEKSRRLTNLNATLFASRSLATVEEVWYKSAHDGLRIQGWIVKPADFDAKKKYPLILEIHGGPFAAYAPHFALDMQLYAAAGYVVFYANPRGSTSYGEKFGNLIHHAYPGHDYDDLMSGVDTVVAKGYIDKDNLFVTGGSGGGVLTAWIVGKTQRFRAAVVCKPVINWTSFVLTSDIYPFFARYWFPGPPWEQAEHYQKRSPLSLVGSVKTPTMLLTGEADHRTPITESEQYYQALKLRKVDTMLVRIPGAPHDIAARPSQLLAKTACVLKWFDMHRKREDDTAVRR